MKNGEFEIGESVQILNEEYRIIGVATSINGYVLESVQGACFAVPKHWVFRFHTSATVYCKSDALAIDQPKSGKLVASLEKVSIMEGE